MIFSKLCECFGFGKASEKTVTSVERLTLTLHGMRGSRVYMLGKDGDETVICRYREVCRDGRNELEAEKSVKCDLQTVTELMNACSVIRWNGFHGKHPKNVSDGIMFRFEATVNGDVTVKADGSANFPKGYREFVRTLDKMLADG